MHKRETFFVGLARYGREVDARGHKRQILALDYRPVSGAFANADQIVFDPALQSYGFINGLVIATSIDGDVKAACPLIAPMHIGAGSAAAFAPGTIIMNLKSLEAIKGIRPTLVS